MIRVQNIYHMLAYAFTVLREQGYRDLASEDFDNAAELLAAILARGVSQQLKRGLGREYVARNEELSTLRGKVDVTESLKTQALLKKRMVCDFDEFSVDSKANRILKCTMSLLARSDISKGRKKEIRKLLVFFADVADVDARDIDWRMRFDRNNQGYRMLVSVCELVVKGLLQTQADGSARMMDFLDEQRMCGLYERFILEYYRREHPALSASAPKIPWAIDDGADDMLPEMRTDVTLSRDGRILIIDAKYYAHALQSYHGASTVHSGNLYQIFAYVKNKEAELVAENVPHEVSGMLLYARTDEDAQPDGTYLMSGNRISVGTLDLDRPFDEIRDRLDGIARAHFGE